MSVNFAAFLAKNFSGDVAVIEANGSGDFEKMAQCEEYCNHISKIEGGFRIGNIYYFYNVARDFSAYLRSRKFAFFVYDMGIEFMRNEEIFLSCNQKIIVGSHLGWRMSRYEQLLSCAKMLEGYRSWEYIDMMKGDGAAYFIDEGRVKLKKMPVIEDALMVSDEAERIYQSFL